MNYSTSEGFSSEVHEYEGFRVLIRRASLRVYVPSGGTLREPYPESQSYLPAPIYDEQEDTYATQAPGTTQSSSRGGIGLTAEYVTQHGYPFESHEITTADGYVLTYHRIPHGKTPTTLRGPILLQHGLVQSSGEWVLAPSSLGYLLADQGFDVWMGNARGNAYSRKHVSLDPDEHREKFWDFSWHEMAYYDLPAGIDYILHNTVNDSLFYCGFSMGTTMFFAMGATRPDYMPKIRASVLMAPVCYPWNIPSPVVNLLKNIAFVLKPNFITHMYEFLPLSEQTAWLGNNFCGFWPIKKLGICEEFLKLIVGYSFHNIERVPLELLLRFTPAGTSYKTFIHFKQIIDEDFAHYDYGKSENLERYGSKRPPHYTISNVTAPIYIYHSRSDWLATPEDVEFLVKQLPNVKKVTEVPEHRFNHGDFFYSTDAKTLVYDDIVATLVKISDGELRGHNVS